MLAVHYKAGNECMHSFVLPATSVFKSLLCSALRDFAILFFHSFFFSAPGDLLACLVVKPAVNNVTESVENVNGCDSSSVFFR